MTEELHPDDDSYIVRVKAVVMTRDDSSGGWLAQEGGGLSRVGVCKVAPPDLDLIGRNGFLIYGERLRDKQLISCGLLDASLVRCSGHVPLVGGPGEDPGHAGETVSRLAWERLGIPPEELDEVVILQCFLKKDLVYTKATPTFHHWRVDNRKCGLTFQSPADARAFDRGVRKAIEDLTEGSTTSSSTLQNETELGDDDVFTNATDSSSNSSQKREPSVQTLAPLSFCEARHHQCILGHLYDQHRHSDHYFLDQAMPSFPRRVAFPLEEEEIVRINPRERVWLTGYEDYRHAHANVTAVAATTTGASTRDKLLRPDPSDAYVTFAKSQAFAKHHYTYPYHGHHPKSTAVAVVTGQPTAKGLPWRIDDVRGVGGGGGGGVERQRCVYCRDVFSPSENGRGRCREAPDPVETWIRRVSFVWCADSLLYHCMSDPEGEYSDPCSCDGADGNGDVDRRFWLRWLALLGLSLLAPCMCCYAPLRACHRCAVALRCCGGRHKAAG